MIELDSAAQSDTSDHVKLVESCKDNVDFTFGLSQKQIVGSRPR